jgi:hypothetical protein
MYVWGGRPFKVVVDVELSTPSGGGWDVALLKLLADLLILVVVVSLTSSKTFVVDCDVVFIFVSEATLVV